MPNPSRSLLPVPPLSLRSLWLPGAAAMRTTRHPRGSLIVYQVSPADGSHTDVREIPIQMQP